MKKLLLFGVGLLMTNVISAQVIFSGISPASVQGNYEMTFGPSGEWGSDDLEDPINSIQDTLVAYKTDTTGCVAATNSAELEGQIAVLFRGDCQFGTKAMNAEAAGAVACVIINNVPGGPVGMAAGDDGANITIPAVMISDMDGAFLLEEMENEDVVVFIGNKQGFFVDDIGMKEGQILRPKYSSIPSALAETGSEYQVDLEAYVYNQGSDDQEGVTVQAIVTFEGDEVYNETSAPSDILSGDSLLFSLPEFAPATWEEGYYELTYQAIIDGTDEYDFDNMFESDFVISPSDLSYASIDEATMKPNSPSGLRPVDGNGNPIPHFSSCITFQDENASRLAPEAITFSASKSNDALDPSLEGEEILFKVIKWNDNFADLNDPGFPNPIQSYDLLMEDSYVYQTDATGESVKADFYFDDIQALEDNQRYLFCATTFNEELYFGHDPDRDYTYNLEYYLQPMFPIEAEQGNYNPVGFGANTVTGVTVNFIDANQVSLKEEKLAIEMNAYPSPASDLLNVDFNKNEVEKVELISMTGQTVLTKDVNQNAETTTMNVASVENGVYIVKAYLTNNMTHTMQVVVSR